MQWDIFCRVVDNFGDIGVCWRLCADLAARGEQVRLWVDDSSALAWMAPEARPGVEVMPWNASKQVTTVRQLRRADVWIEAFGCDIPEGFIAAFVGLQALGGAGETARPVWLNLEYLSAEPYVERVHGLPSPVMQGPARGWTKHFFYPGFTTKTGGLLRERNLDAARQAFLTTGEGSLKTERWISLFCYEPPALVDLLRCVSEGSIPTLLLVTAGRASAAVRAHMGPLTERGNLRLRYLPAMSQVKYDQLLWACDINFVRGEDSMVRAIWAAKPFVWQIYPQSDNAHVEKLGAFLNAMQADPTMRALHMAWNGIDGAPSTDRVPPCWKLLKHEESMASWSASALRAHRRLSEMDDLTTQLLQFVSKNR